MSNEPENPRRRMTVSRVRAVVSRMPPAPPTAAASGTMAEALREASSVAARAASRPTGERTAAGSTPATRRAARTPRAPKATIASNERSPARATRFAMAWESCPPADSAAGRPARGVARAQATSAHPRMG